MMASETGLGLGAEASAIMSNQGILGFYKGIDANVMRAIVNNGTKMDCYDTSKNLIKDNCPAPLNDGVPLQALASFVAGFFMTCTVAPFDICRTRLMNQPADKPKIYTNLFQTFTKFVVDESPMALWRGFIPMWSGIAPTTTMQLLFFEKFTQMAGLHAT